jgi:hypothetical protein
LGTFPAFAQDDAAAARTAAGCGPSGEMFDVQSTDSKHPVQQPENGKALVYFIVDFLNAPTMRVGVDGNWVGANNGKSYFFFQVDPGEHNICTEWQSGTFKKSSQRVGEAMHLTTEAGKTYYLRLIFAFQRMQLEQADQAEGRFLIGSAFFATSKPKKK